MGVEARILLYADSDADARSAAAAAFARLDAVDACLSDYRADSEALRLCARGPGPPQRVTADLFDVLTLARSVHAASAGAFDVTIGPHTQLWRAARATGSAPGAGELAAARAASGFERLVLDPARRTVQLRARNMRLDFGGIGKGFGADAALALLVARDHAQALVEVGGDLSLGAPPPSATGWSVDVACGSATPVRLTLAHCGLATSGDAVQFAVIDGERSGHHLDPQTGRGTQRSTCSAIVATSGALADALSTAACLLDPLELVALLEAFPGAHAVRLAPSEPPTPSLPAAEAGGPD